ncbi:MAG: DUF4112 domain-containing protein [Gammaproteobacteria bacterium]
MRRLARLLDSSIPLPGGFRIGLDGLLGLVPGVGDLLGAALSLYIVAGAHRLGASRAVLARMLANVALETVVGAVPLVGDLFDFVWKANQRNLALLERELAQPVETRRRSFLLMLALALAAFAVMGLAVAAVVALARALWQLLAT